MDSCTETTVGYWVQVIPQSLNSSSTNKHLWSAYSLSGTILIHILCALSNVMPTTTQNFWSNHWASLCHSQDWNPSILPPKPVFLCIPYVLTSSALGKSHFLNLGLLNSHDSYTCSVSSPWLSPLQMLILLSPQQSWEVGGANPLDQATQLVNGRVGFECCSVCL